MSNGEIVLARLIAEDAAFAERLRRNTKLVEQDKKNLLTRAEEYRKMHEQEILEGTEKMKLLLTEGAARGLTEEQVIEGYGKFLPTVRTPILNMLYFMLREDTPDWLEVKKEFESKFGGVHEDFDLDEAQLNKKYGHLEHEQDLSDNVKEPEEMDKFLYGSMTHETFKTIKKLKALSKSSNEHEAFLAYRMCLKLCEKHHLEFDKIPCNIE